MDKKIIVTAAVFCLSGCSVTSSTSNQTIDIKMAEDKYDRALSNHIQVTVDDRVTFTGERRISVSRTKPSLKVKYGSLPEDVHQCIVDDTMVIHQHDDDDNKGIGIYDPLTPIATNVTRSALFSFSTSPSSALLPSSSSSDFTSSNSGTWVYGYDRNEYEYSPQIIDSEECREWIKPYLKEKALYREGDNCVLNTSDCFESVIPGNPADGLKQLGPDGQIRRLDPTDGIRKLDPTEQIRQLNPADRIREFDPAEQIKQLDPTDRIREFDPAEQIKQLDPTDRIREFDPAEQIKQLNPADRIREFDPAEQIKQLAPTDRIREIDPTDRIKQLAPTEKIRELNPSDSIKRLNPADEIMNAENDFENVYDGTGSLNP